MLTSISLKNLVSRIHFANRNVGNDYMNFHNYWNPGMKKYKCKEDKFRVFTKNSSSRRKV